MPCGVATVSALAWAATAASTATCAKSAGSSPAMRRVNSAASSGCAARVGGEARRPTSASAAGAAWPARPSRAYTSSGITNGACGQPSASRVSLISSAPSASPCALAVPARFGRALADRRSCSRSASACRSLARACGDRRVDRVDVVAVDVGDHVPAVGLEALRRVVDEPGRDRGRRSRCRCRRRARSACPASRRRPARRPRG